MNQILGFVVGLLQSALSLLGFVQTHPDLPQASKDQANQVAQQAITQATTLLKTNPPPQTVTPGPSQTAITGVYRVNGMLGTARFVPDKPSNIQSIAFTNSVEAYGMFHQGYVSVSNETPFFSKSGTMQRRVR